MRLRRKPAAAERFTTPADRAAEAWRALRAHGLTQLGESVMALDGPGRGAPGAALWPLSQVLAAAIAVEAMPADTGDKIATGLGLLHGLERYRHGAAYGPNPGDRNRYYDDNAWIALEFLQLYLETEEGRYLDHARRVFSFVMEGESPGGGVWWVEHPKTSRHTCSTGPAIEVALRLHLLTRDAAMVAFAERQDAFLDRALRSPEGLYWDHIDLSGKVDETFWSYNQGTPLGADVLWHRITGEADRLTRARQTADAALAHYGRDDRLWKQPAVFNVVFFRNLLALHAATGEQRYLQALDAYLERVWTTARNPASGLLIDGGIGRYEGGGTIDHAALTSLFALRAWPAARWPDVC